MGVAKLALSVAPAMHMHGWVRCLPQSLFEEQSKGSLCPRRESRSADFDVPDQHCFVPRHFCAAREKFKVSHQPLESAVWFLAIGKKSLVQSLCKSVGDPKLTAFFAYVESLCDGPCRVSDVWSMDSSRLERLLCTRGARSFSLFRCLRRALILTW